MLLATILIASVVIILLSITLLHTFMQLLKLKKLISLTQLKLVKETKHQESLATELTLLKEKFVRDVLYDSLTELPGRRVFEDRLKQTFNQSKRYQLTFAVMFLDLDGFKVINNALGYETGDQLLKEVALRLQNSIRQVDSVSRFCADEFVVLAAQLSKPESAVYVAQRLIDAVALPIKINDQELYVTASIGIATFPADGDDPMTILKNADNALHQAKLRGNCYQFYRAEMHALSQRDLILNSSLQNPTIYQEFEISYQPQIDTEKQKIISMQAILYWRHADFGLLSLNDFLRQAENSGKILEIGDWLIRNALQQFYQWQKFNFQLEAIAVTVSARQLENPHFAYKISQLFQEMNLSPSVLILEISEVMLITKLDVIEKVFHMLKHLGVQLTIKDFGIGKLSLQHLKRFPIDSLKIANSLVHEAPLNKDVAGIIKMIVAIAKSLQINVAAEGVETQKQVQLLKEMGCYILQGDYFSPPLLADQLTKDKIQSVYK